ncbi:unnamed protein product [Boreogadus saida]
MGAAILNSVSEFCSVTTEFNRDGEFAVLGKGACLCVSLGNVLGPPRRMDIKTQHQTDHACSGGCVKGNTQTVSLDLGTGQAEWFACTDGTAVGINFAIPSLFKPIVEWADINNMELNQEKFQLLHHGKIVDLKLPYTLPSGQLLQGATSFKSKQSKDLSLPRYRAFVISATGIASDASRCTPCSDGGKALYNVVPPNIKSLTTLTTFKPALDVFLNSFPDTPPTPGYTGQNRNSVLEWAGSNYL